MQVFHVSFPVTMHHRHSCHASLEELSSFHFEHDPFASSLVAFLVICFICCLPPLKKCPPYAIVMGYFVITCVAYTLEFNGIFEHALRLLEYQSHLFHQDQRDSSEFISRHLRSRPLHVLSNCLSFTMGLKVSHENENAKHLRSTVISCFLLSYSFVSFFINMLHFGVSLVATLSPCD